VFHSQMFCFWLLGSMGIHLSCVSKCNVLYFLVIYIHVYNLLKVVSVLATDPKVAGSNPAKMMDF
jgi:hypothetical protein